MKKTLFLLLACSTSGMAVAVDIARVLSATPVVQQVAVPKQLCTQQTVEVQRLSSGAGAAMGAIAGGVIGRAAAGPGPGRAAATVLGAVGGAILGDHIEGPPDTELRTVRQCSTQTVYENRAVAYHVVYEFAGKQYTAQMPHDPGPRLALHIGPASATGELAQEQVLVPERSFAPAAPVYVQPPVLVTYSYPRSYARPYSPAVSLELVAGHWNGAQRHSSRHGGRIVHRGGHAPHWR